MKVFKITFVDKNLSFFYEVWCHRSQLEVSESADRLEDEKVAVGGEETFQLALRQFGQTDNWSNQIAVIAVHGPGEHNEGFGNIGIQLSWNLFIATRGRYIIGLKLRCFKKAMEKF